MTSKPCSLCFRALRRQSRMSKSATPSMRSFMATPHFYADLPEPGQPFASSVPPVSPMRAEGQNKISTAAPGSASAISELRKVTGRATETYTAYGVTERLIKECAWQADYSIPQAKNYEEMPKTEDGEDLGVGGGFWHTEMGLKPTFSTWSQVTMLHMYLLSARYRCFPAAHSQIWQQHLLDHFFYDAENRMAVNHNMHATGTRNKYLKDLFVQWRGVLLAYDEGLAKSDAVLAAAVWRNVFKADENVDIKNLAMCVSYMRRVLKGLDALPDESMARGEVTFGNPSSELDLVTEKSRMLDLPFKDGSIINEPVETKG